MTIALNSLEVCEETCTDPRVTVIFNGKNLGVGGAMKTGYLRALADGAEIIVKLDGDGQMNPGPYIPSRGTYPEQNSDYVKGNRFYDLGFLRTMPFVRKLGNSGVSFMNKLSSGYWNTMDPSNGFTAIHRKALENLPLDRIDNRFFLRKRYAFPAFTPFVLLLPKCQCRRCIMTRTVT